MSCIMGIIGLMSETKGLYQIIIRLFSFEKQQPAQQVHEINVQRKLFCCANNGFPAGVEITDTNSSRVSL